jgi:hypothetical protein
LYLPINDLPILSLMVLTCLLVAGTTSLILIRSCRSQGRPPGDPTEMNASEVVGGWHYPSSQSRANLD